MGTRSIPAPTNTDFSIALKAILTQAQATGVDVFSDGPQVLNLLTHQAEVQAQMAAEIRFLRNLTHPK
jgi:hypothetical protein